MQKCSWRQEPPVPPAVEDVGGDEEEEVLGTQDARPPIDPLVQDPVRRENDGQEQQEFEGVEEHRVRPRLSAV